MRALVSWPWPGNVRELENFIERSVILSRAPASVLLWLNYSPTRRKPPAAHARGMERDYILRVFRETGGVVSAAAMRLGIPRTTLNAMMKKLGISRTDL